MTYMPDTLCLSSAHVILIVVAALSAVLMLVAYPLAMVLVIRRLLVTPRTEDHERYVQLKETEYVVRPHNPCLCRALGR
jgi:hypothetical protein